jgi:hypothetical protein
MFLKYHRADFKRLVDKDAVAEAIRKIGRLLASTSSPIAASPSR